MSVFLVRIHSILRNKLVVTFVSFLSLGRFNLVHAIFLCNRTTGLRPTLLQPMDMGSLMDAQIHAVHMKGGQAQTSLHKSGLRGPEKLSLVLLCEGIERSSD